jgi:integrator complex subunit 11
MVERRGDPDFYTEEDIKSCVKRVTPLQLCETVVVDGDVEVTAFYAGHVLGRLERCARVFLPVGCRRAPPHPPPHPTRATTPRAPARGVGVARCLLCCIVLWVGACMYRVRVGDQSIVYTGDFTTSPDRHLGACTSERCNFGLGTRGCVPWRYSYPRVQRMLFEQALRGSTAAAPT